MPTSADPFPRRAAVVGALLALVVVADLRTVVHLRSQRPPCAVRELPGRTALDIALHVTDPVLRAGGDAAGFAVVTNRSPATVVLLRADAVLVETGTRTPLSWVDTGTFRPVDLRPGTYATVPFVAHLAGCRGRPAALRPGFYEVVLVLVEQRGDELHATASTPQAVVLSP